MILILSREVEEPLTCRVIDYLDHYKANYIRVNGEDLVNGKVIFNFSLNKLIGKWELDIIFDDRKVSSNEIKTVWFRRSFFQLSNLNEQTIINEFLKSELNILYSNLENVFDHAFWINKPSDRYVNKLFMLKKASENGLLVPDTYITNHISFLNNLQKDIITKPISESFSIVEKGVRKTAFTSSVNKNVLKSESYTDFFFPSFIQERLNKEYEIRSFYLCGEIFSIAIFSQNDKKTELDFRNYNEEIPNKNSRYHLPSDIEENIKRFMQDVGISCGSIDFVKTEDNNYYFLELNPVGQAGVISRFGHYNLEKKIASKLIENDK